MRIVVGLLVGLVVAPIALHLGRVAWLYWRVYQVGGLAFVRVLWRSRAL